jgi:hypothetical protein
VRPFVVTLAVGLILASGRGGSAAAAPDGGVRPAPARDDGPAGAFLGPLKKPGDPDPERRYPLKPGANGTLLYEAPQFSAVVAPDGTVTFHDRRLAYSAPKSTFSFDLTDEFVRELAHGTAYPYPKANFLAATFERRTAMAAEVNSRQMRAARADLPHQLDALWDDTRYRRRERRRIVFLLWQEVDRSSADGRSTAATIEAWIRKRLPRGSPDAYNDQELDAYSHERRGVPAFNPYGASSGSPSGSPSSSPSGSSSGSLLEMRRPAP